MSLYTSVRKSQVLQSSRRCGASQRGGAADQGHAELPAACLSFEPFIGYDVFVEYATQLNADYDLKRH